MVVVFFSALFKQILRCISTMLSLSAAGQLKSAHQAGELYVGWLWCSGAGGAHPSPGWSPPGPGLPTVSAVNWDGKQSLPERRFLASSGLMISMKSNCGMGMTP